MQTASTPVTTWNPKGLDLDTEPLGRPSALRPPSAWWALGLPVAIALLVLTAVGEALGTLWYLPPGEATATATTARRGLLFGGAWLGLGALVAAATHRLGPGRHLGAALLAGIGAVGVLGAGLFRWLSAAPGSALRVGAGPIWLHVALLALAGVSLGAALTPSGRGARITTLAIGAAGGAGLLAGWREASLPLLLGTLAGLLALLGLAFGAAGRSARALYGLLGSAALAAVLVPSASAALAEVGFPGLCGPCALGLAVAVLAIGAAGARSAG